MISIKGTSFRDEHGRTLLLRGVNLHTKVPFRPDGSTYIRDGFFAHRSVSFVGRPFPLEEADEHYARLKKWGLTFIRFLVPWEAIEHEGPGIYDEEYLDFLYKIVKKAGSYGMNLYIDTRQDVWSRYSGGDGAPAWTFDLIGMDIMRFKQTGAAVTQQEYGAEYLPQIWATNGCRPAAATMYTLFFGGNDFAPLTKVEGLPVQEYLQRVLINAYKQVAERLKGMDCVLGYDTMNEPWKGYIGCANLNSTRWYAYRNGDAPTAFQGMLLGAGFPQEVEVWRAYPPKLMGKRVLNGEGVKVWRDGFDCVWKINGVWDVDGSGTPVLKRPDHFVNVAGRKVDFNRDYLRPYYNRFAEGIRSVDPGAVIFLTPANDEYVPPPWGENDALNIVYKPHWYDNIHWISKSYSTFPHAFMGHDTLARKLITGLPVKIQNSFNYQLRRLKELGNGLHGGVPTIIGETGICYDMNEKRAYKDKNYKNHLKVWGRIFRALDANLLGYNLWTYNPINDNVHGDHWNMEDFSIFSRDQQTDPGDINSGGRALEAVVRPYPRAVPGEILRISFNMKRRIFEFEFRHDPAVSQPAEIFIPDFQYPGGYRVKVSDGTYIQDRDNQLLIYTHDSRRGKHLVQVRPA